MIFKNITFGERLAVANGRPAGFDYLRLFLAIEVLIWHTVLMTRGKDFQTDVLNHSLWRALPPMILMMFFALSGFLVAGSLERTKNIADFIALRLLRIMPAIWFVIFFLALVAGPALTTLPLREYFNNRDFFHYFLNLICDVHYTLPGVFANNPDANAVNGQLWTIPLELTCYAMLALLALLQIFKHPRLMLCLFLLVQVLFAWRAVAEPVIWGGVSAKLLYLSFLGGSLVYLHRNRIPYSFSLACLCALAAYGLIYIPGGSYFIAAPAAYLTIYLGLQNPRRTWIVRSGDYSYGIYLIAYPIQQFVVSFAVGVQPWYLNLLASLPLTFMFAFVSWHLVEKRALSYRHYIPQLYRVPVTIYLKTKQRLGSKHNMVKR